MRKAIRNGKVCKTRHTLDLEKYPTYVVGDFIKGKMLAPDFRWAFVSWIPGSRVGDLRKLKTDYVGEVAE